MKISAKSNHVSLIIVGAHRWETFSIFNGNAFPDSLRYGVDACGIRLSLCLFYTSAVSEEVSKDRERFIEALEMQRDDIKRGLSKKQNSLNLVGYSDGLGYMAATYGCLNAMKSFLDVYAQLIGKLILPSTNLSFKRRTIDGRKIAGGTLISWLRTSAPRTFHNAKDLADITTRHSIAWITEAVRHRDTLSHYADLKRMTHMHVPLEAKDPFYDPDNIVPPKMPNGVPLVEYCQSVLANLSGYLRESITLLPNIRKDLIRPNRFLNRGD
jgi:hypothetical protein